MKSSLLLLVIILSLPNSIFSTCIDFNNPLSLSDFSVVDCTPEQKDSNTFISSDVNFQLNGELFQLSFNCQIPDQDLCSKVENTFNMAGDIITRSLVLNTPITVSAKFYALDDPKLLGGASPARYISLLDEEDQVERFYPQALVKQFQLKNPVTYTDSDIKAEFNSLVDWYIPGNVKSIRKNQHDLLGTVLHEMIHGLGFVSSWRDYTDDNSLSIGLTPFILNNETAAEDPQDVPDGQFRFLGFYETIFDKFIIVRKNGIQNRLSKYANDLNGFTGINQQFTLSNFITELQNSPQYDSAKQVLSFSGGTEDSLIFMPIGSTSIPDDGIVLETQIPYKKGSSISHVSFSIYKPGNPDFLMRYISSSGETTNDLVIKSGNVTGNAIGPKLLRILNSIGYELASNPTIKSSSNKNSISMINFFVLISQIIIIIINNHIL